jgi:hemolysin activation/secretion protein
VGRVDVQLANDALVPIEQFAIGGPDSVRGYRQNQLVRDGGAVGSLELRIPVWRTLEGRAILQVAGFLDYGRGWSHGRDDSDADNLAGAGVGLRWTVADGLNATVYWAAELEGVREPDDRSLQDRGITFAVSYRPVWN